MGRYWFRLRRFLLHKVLHADDTPHAIALGVAAAMLVAFLPLVGFQTVIAIGLAALLRANKAVCVPVVWITNPFTIVPIYGACFALGRFVLPSATVTGDAEVLRTLEQGGVPAGVLELAYWKHMFGQLAGLGLELWVGCLIVGLTLGVFSYVASKWGIVHYRERRREKILKRNLFLSRKRGTTVSRHDGTL